MSQPVVVVTPDPAPAVEAAGTGDVAAALAAGGAVVEAEHAAEDAAEALAVAELAADTADAALSAAWQAPSREEIEAMRARLDFLEGQQVQVAEVTEMDELAEESMTPPRKTEPPADPKPAAKESKKRYGSDSWFGGRD